MRLKKLNTYLTSVLLLLLLSIFLVSCLGCGGVKKGGGVMSEKLSNLPDADISDKTVDENEVINSSNQSHIEKRIDQKVKAKKRYKFNQSKAQKDAELRYPEHEIRGSLKGDTILYFWAESRASRSLEYLVKYNNSGDFIDILDLTKSNPYRDYISYEKVEGTHHQMLGNNVVVDGKKDIIKENIPKLLFDLTPNDFYISALNPYISTEISPDKSKILIRYGLHLLPGEEILEHQNYPGINTYVVIDVNSGEEINRIADLSFIPYSETLTKNGKYLIVAHTQDMTESNYSTLEEDWKHQASVYSIESGKLCFRIEGKNECSYIHRTINGLSEIFISGFECYDQYSNQDTLKQYFIKDDAIIVREVSLKEGIVSKYSTTEYEAIKTKEGKIIKYYYDSDYVKIKRLCN